MREYFTEAERKTLEENIVILCDTREQSNGHIIGYFNSHGIRYENKKLDTGDYSFYIPKIPGIIERAIGFDKEIAIERKANLDELASNLTKGRERLKDELKRAENMRFFLMIEGAVFEDIGNHNYKSQFNPKAFCASLTSMELEYGFTTKFVPKYYAGGLIYTTMKHYLRLKLSERI